MGRLRSVAPAGAFLWLLALSTAALAQDDRADYARSGFYVGGGMNGAFNPFEGELQDATSPLIKLKHSLGAHARVGYRAASFFAIEAQYEWLDGLKGEVGSVGEVLKISPQTITANLKFLLPFGRVQPYLLLGAGGSYYTIKERPPGLLDAFGVPGTTTGKKSQWALAARLALGLDLYVTQHVALYAEAAGVVSATDLNRPISTNNLSSPQYISAGAGLMYRF